MHQLTDLKEQVKSTSLTRADKFQIMSRIHELDDKVNYYKSEVKIVANQYELNRKKLSDMENELNKLHSRSKIVSEEIDDIKKLQDQLRHHERLYHIINNELTTQRNSLRGLKGVLNKIEKRKEEIKENSKLFDEKLSSLNQLNKSYSE